jgi:photosystem II stability/assembly factor-like uncharacterized protein
MMKKCLLLLLFTELFSLSFLSAQEKPSLPYISPDAPAWMWMLAKEEAPLADIQEAYKTYYRANPFVKNDYTQYYKHWMHWARTRLRADGTVRDNTPEETTDAEQRLLKDRSAAQTRRQPANWTFIGPKQTYDIDGNPELTWQTNIYALDIAPSNSDILYAGGETGGIWKTTNKGLNWTLLTANVRHDGFSAVRIHPLNPDTVYAATNGKIIKTTDGGSTWTTVYSENKLTVHELAIKADDPKIVLAASSLGLLRSTNGGANWTRLFTNLTWAVKFRPGLPSEVYAIRKNGKSSDFVKSTTGGASFSASNTGLWAPTLSSDSITGAHIAVCPSNPTKLYTYFCAAGVNLYGYVGVFVSNNSGASWANTHPSGAIGHSPTPYSMPTHTNLMSSNGTTGLQQGFYDMAIIVNPANDQQLIAGGTSWYKSTDGGVTWTGLGGYQSGLSWSHPDIQALAVSGSDLWIASDGGLNYSTDFGGSITARMNGISGSDMWGFDAGWNEDVLVGGRYHNGNMAYHQSFPAGKFYRMGGAESPTGYVNPGENKRMYFSDIGGKWLRGGFGNGVANAPMGLSPNESYAYYANSEMTWDPRCWNIVYAGKDNIIWKSTDGGASYSPLYTFPGTASNVVYEIEVSRTNPNVMYCSQWDGTDDAIWKTTNGGTSWAKLTALPLPNNNDRVKMSLSATDPNVLWVAVTYGDNGKKVYKTTNGGVSWTNLTTTTLNGIRISDIMAQHGTDGGVYIGCDGAVFYRNNSHTDWQPYSTGLPISAETNRLKPFYRDGKIRNGCWGFGVWESPLFEASAPIVQPMTSALEPNCIRDTVYFDDYSVVQHAGATWNWAFAPAPAYVSATNVRNPKVVFGATGTYTATLTLNGSLSKSLTITVGNACAADTIPGQMVTLGGNAAPGHVSVPTINRLTNTLTLTAWIKIDGIQPDYSAIFMHDGTDVAGFNFRPGANRLGYHWPSGSWGWDSGPIVPTGVWTHVAMVVEPTGITLYANGVGVKHSFTVPMANLNDIIRVGNYRGWDTRYVKGSIDEVCIFTTSLSQSAIRELMHHTLAPVDHPSLVAYYQFNETNGRALDRVGIRHADLVSNAVRGTSGAPFGKGTSVRVNVTSSGVKTFGNTGVQMTFSSSVPNGEVMVSRINQPPYLPPNPAQQLTSGGYWVINNFNQNNIPTNITFAPGKGIYPPDPANIFALSGRPAFSDVSNWATADAQGDAIVGNALTFSSGLTFSYGQQYAITDGKGVRLNMKVLLEGPLDVGTGKMSDQLRASGLLPNTEPYTTLGFVHKNGGGAETVLPAVWSTTGDNALTDWLMVELRDKNNPANVLYTRTALLQKDGDVADLDGTSSLLITQAPPDNYYIALRHRNHFGFRTLNGFNLSSTVANLNFTNNTVALYGVNPLKSIGTLRAMYTGDANRDGVINAADRNLFWRVQNGGVFNYMTSTADFDLNGAVNLIDRDAFWKLNNSAIQWLD